MTSHQLLVSEFKPRHLDTHNYRDQLFQCVLSNPSTAACFLTKDKLSTPAHDSKGHMLPTGSQSNGHEQEGRRSNCFCPSPLTIPLNTHRLKHHGPVEAVGEVFNVMPILVGVHYYADRHHPLLPVFILLRSCLLMCTACVEHEAETGGTFAIGSHAWRGGS